MKTYFEWVVISALILLVPAVILLALFVGNIVDFMKEGMLIICFVLFLLVISLLGLVIEMATE